MTTQQASDAQAAQAIETISQAAAEITRLYAVFEEAAVELTSKYIQQRLAGEKGVTWVMFPGGGFRSRPTPILDAIVRQKGVIHLGAGYNHWADLLVEYWLTKVDVPPPGAGEAFVADTITVHRSKRGFDPGDKYVVAGEHVLKAGYGHHRSIPTVGDDGKMAWSTPRDFVNDKFHALTEVDSDLQKVIERLRAYEPTVAE